MTVTYTSQVANCRGFGCFWKLLFRWKGSIYKLVWPDLLAYSVLYFLFSAIYRFALSEERKRLFEQVSLHTQYYTEYIPISFVLGFYVSIVVQRWWAQYENLPWPDSLSLYISTSIPGNDDKARMMRRTIVRYANLAFTLTLRMVSPQVKKRFPTLDHLVEAGLFTANEKKIFKDLSLKTPHPTHWMPFVWAGTVVARARKEGRIRDDFAVKTIIDEINRLRGLCGTILSYDWISIPLVYTQVVTLAVYAFFLATLMGRQFLDPQMNYEKHNVDFVIPVFTYLQFFFYMGWLKVAESLVNPFGEDDDDFETNWLVDRNLQVSYLIVDEMHNEHPELIQDIYWDEVYPIELPYTIAAQEFRTIPHLGSTANLSIPTEEQELLPMLEEESNEEMIGAEYEYQGDSFSHINMKRIGSNLSSFFRQPSTLFSSVTSFPSRNSYTMRRPSSKKRMRRVSSKSSANTMSPSASRKMKQFYHKSESSFSDSDMYHLENHPLSSKDSINGDHSMLGRKKRFNDDEGIQINMNKKDQNLERNVSDIENVDDYRDIRIGSPTAPIYFKRKKRTMSGDSSYSHADLEKVKPFPGKEFPPGMAPVKLIDFLRPSLSASTSSVSLKDHDYRKTPMSKHSHPNIIRKPSLREEFQSRRPYPRGPFLKGMTSSRESGRAAEQVQPSGTSQNPNSLNEDQVLAENKIQLEENESQFSGDQG